MPSSRESELYRLLYELRYGHGRSDDVGTELLAWLRAAQKVFAAARGALATLDGTRRTAELRLAWPQGGEWDRQLLAAFLRNERTTPPPELIVAPVHRRGRLWAVLALLRDGAAFERGDGKALARLTRALSERLAEIDDARARAVQERIERKILSRLRPQDVFYQLLHGLRSLTRYDHSSALLIRTGTGDLELVAEQAAWSKTKSRFVGLRIPVGEAVGRALDTGEVTGFDRDGDRWVPWRQGHDPAIASALAFHTRDDGAPPEHALICAPLRLRDRLVGVLKVAARTGLRLGPHEAELLRRFQLYAAVAVDNLRETETLRRDVLRAERKHAMVNVARGISHDVNNALGAILPVVQQLRSELEEGTFDTARAQLDLGHVEQAMQTCRRVFAGLVEFARNRERPRGGGDLRRAVDNALAILQGSLNRHEIAVRIAFPRDLPSVRGAQHELEQLVLNLASNACDAMPMGGTMEIAAAVRDGHVDLTVCDHGVGMSRETLQRAAEAFFTTKPNGNGLGLSICYSIVQDVRGRIRIDSVEGRGTTVHVALPLAAQPVEGGTG